MKRRDLLLSVSGVAIAGCSGGGETGDADEATISLTELGFDPRQLSVDVGTTVTWENDDNRTLRRHRIESRRIIDDASEWEFDAELDAEGDTATYTFEESGLYTYVDSVEGPCLCGLVAVGDASYGDPLPCSPAAGGDC